jgi:hypothetical protein
MAVEAIKPGRDHKNNGPAVSDFGQRTDGHAPTVTDLPSIDHDGHSEDLLKINLEILRGNADALLDISVKLQKLGREQKAEIQKLQAEKASDLIITPSTSESRRKTDESHSSGATTMSVDNDETVVVYSASDNELMVRQRRSMKDTDYIRADLPSFHWWSDRLHIYFERPSDSSEHENLQVIVVKDEFDEFSGRDVKLHRTVRLAKLGIRIRVRRMLGQIKFIYVLSPRAKATHVGEATAQHGRSGSKSLTKINLVS